jgi:predicted RNase H-like nuclease (RuvC/YqgF family)
MYMAKKPKIKLQKRLDLLKRLDAQRKLVEKLEKDAELLSSVNILRKHEVSELEKELEKMRAIVPDEAFDLDKEEKES